MIKECSNCKLEKEHHAKGLCYSCYKKLKWSPKTSSCARCKRDSAIHARGYCASCYNALFHADKHRAYHHRKSRGLDLRTFRKVTKHCVVCGFDKIVDVFHLDGNRSNVALSNLVGLCPNHHRMVNNKKHRFEVFSLLRGAGVKLPEVLE